MISTSACQQEYHTKKYNRQYGNGDPPQFSAVFFLQHKIHNRTCQYNINTDCQKDYNYGISCHRRETICCITQLVGDFRPCIFSFRIIQTTAKPFQHSCLLGHIGKRRQTQSKMVQQHITAAIRHERSQRRTICLPFYRRLFCGNSCNSQRRRQGQSSSIRRGNAADTLGTVQRNIHKIQTGKNFLCLHPCTQYKKSPIIHPVFQGFFLGISQCSCIKIVDDEHREIFHNTLGFRERIPIQEENRSFFRQVHTCQILYLCRLFTENAHSHRFWRKGVHRHMFLKYHIAALIHQ